MSSLFRRSGFARFLLCGALALLPASMFGQLNSTAANVTLNATLAETLTIVPNVGNVSFALVAGGTAVGGTPVSILTTWVLKPTRSTVNLYGWFATAASALTDGSGDNIASSLVLGSMNAGAYNAFSTSATLGTANAGLQLFTQAITSSNRSSNRTDSLNLEINLATLPQLPAGIYTGTLILQAQAN